MGIFSESLSDVVDSVQGRPGRPKKGEKALICVYQFLERKEMLMWFFKKYICGCPVAPCNVLDSIQGRKALVLDPQISGPLGLVSGEKEEEKGQGSKNKLQRPVELQCGEEHNQGK